MSTDFWLVKLIMIMIFPVLLLLAVGTHSAPEDKCNKLNGSLTASQWSELMAMHKEKTRLIVNDIDCVDEAFRKWNAELKVAADKVEKLDSSGDLSTEDYAIREEGFYELKEDGILDLEETDGPINLKKEDSSYIKIRGKEYSRQEFVDRVKFLTNKIE